MIAVAHDLAAWGQTAQALHWNATTLTLTVDYALTWSGSRFLTPLPYTGLDYEPTTVILGSAELVVVTGIKPRGLDRVEITGVVEDESVHTLV